MTTTKRPFAFTPENKTRVAEIIQKYPKGRAASAVMPILDLAQRQNGGWLSEGALDEVAAILCMPTMRVHEVASFYSMYHLKPVGRHVIYVCRTTPCWLNGGEEITRAMEKHLGVSVGETSEDGLFTLCEAECLGACTGAPAMQVDDDIYEKLTPTSVVALLKEIAAGKVPDAGTYPRYEPSGKCSCKDKEGLS